jgi:hypothetical protein
MERSIRDNDYVLIICTPRYKHRSDNREGGVGYEGDIMTGEVFAKSNHRKFIPVHRCGTWAEAAPSWLQSKYYVDLSDEPYAEDKYRDLLFTLHGQRSNAPPVGTPFSTTAPPPSVGSSVSLDESEIRILGVAVDQVTMPRLDGSRGSALYRVPFHLSRRPSADWATLFVQNWNRPPRFTTMHRPGIARVEGSTIVLDGTTLDEVEKYHRDTLVLALEETNRQYGEKTERQAAEHNRRAQLEQAHRQQVDSKARNIKFD